jgi:hypothetical protein
MAKIKVYTLQISEEAYSFFADIMNLNSIVEKLRPCQHTNWEGIPEVDAQCSKCGMDEFEVDCENTRLWNEAEKLYGHKL